MNKHFPGNMVLRRGALVGMMTALTLGCNLGSTNAIADSEKDAGGNAEFETVQKQGEEALFAVCTDCHATDLIFDGPRMSSRQWDYTINDMIGRGAEGTDEQLDLIRAYLKQTWGTVGVNRANATELSEILGLSEDAAAKLVTYREEHGQFTDLAGLKKVPGIDPALLDSHAGAIVFN